MLWPILILIPFSALAMGAVHPWAYWILEVAAYASGIAWMCQIILGRRAWRLNGTNGGIAAGVVGLLIVTIVQLLPMPPRLLKHISPGAYSAYSQAFPGWPRKSAYSWVKFINGDTSAHRSLPTEEEVRLGAGVPFHPNQARSASVESRTLPAGAWLPASVSPSMTRRALLKAIAYVVIFGLVLFYASDSRENSKFHTNVVRVVLLTGLTISLIGLSQPMFSNGRPLWIFHPYDWGDGMPWGERLFGNFANPDHYADYLAMVWSFVLAGLVFPDIFGRAKNKSAVPLLFGSVGITVLAALIGTASRGGWLGAFAATLTILWYADRLPMEARPSFMRYGLGGKRALMVASLGFGILCAGLFFTNVSSRTEAGSRAYDALSSESLSQRLGPSRNSLAMIATMPVLGAGMGTWPVIYTKYASPPWTGQFINAAHDEYIQFASEMGLVGLLVAAWTIWFVLRTLRRPVESSGSAGIAAACAGAVVAVGLHSVFDFPLRIPANALLAVICLALLLRISSGDAKREDERVPIASRVYAGVVASLLLIAGWAALTQPSKPFPYDMNTPTTLADAVDNIFRYPTFPRAHLQLARLLYERQAGASYRLEEITATLALEPLNPIARDMRAGDLFLAGERPKAFEEMEHSTADAPAPEFHFYLNSRYLPWLSKDERAAVIAGLSRAVQNGYWPATDALTNVYETFAMYEHEARLMLYLADKETDSSLKSNDLNKAGLAFARAGKLDDAKRALELAISVDPANANAYRNLATEVYARRKDFEHARDTVDRGIAGGIPAAPLYVALADVEIQNQDQSAAEKALEQAAALEPFNFEIVRRLGLTYLNDRKYDNAAAWLRKATELNPQFARSYYELGLAEESDYQYFPADKAFVRAIALDNQNAEYAAHYVEFKKKVESARNQ